MKQLKETYKYTKLLQETYLEYIISNNRYLQELTNRPIEDLRFAYRIYRDLIRILEHAISKEDKRNAYLIMNANLNGLMSQIPNKKILLSHPNISKTPDGYKINVESKYKNKIYDVVFCLGYHNVKKGEGGFDCYTQEIELDILETSPDYITLYELADFFRHPESPIHEITHYIDWLRKENKEIPDDVLTSGEHNYYNNQDELNAFTQQLLINIRNWFIYDANPREQLEVLQNPDKTELLLNQLCLPLTTHKGRSSEYDRMALHNFWGQLSDENRKEVVNQVCQYIKNSLSKINTKRENIEELTIFDYFCDI